MTAIEVLDLSRLGRPHPVVDGRHAGVLALNPSDRRDRVLYSSGYESDLPG